MLNRRSVVSRCLTTGALALLATSSLSACATTQQKPECKCEHKDGEGKCGAEHKCGGEGKCGGDKAAAPATTAPTTTPDAGTKTPEGSCGEGSCGGAK